MNKFKNWLIRFMRGRYGTDRLNTVMLWAGVIMVVLAFFIPSPVPYALLHLGAYAMMGLAIFRTFSRNTYKRYRENQRFSLLLDQIKDRSHRYFYCPRCRQPVRVPRHKGKIAITCPKCREKFVRKT